MKYMTKRTVVAVLMAVVAMVAQAQMMNPVHFKSELKELKGGEGEIIFSATIDSGWHVYSTDLGNVTSNSSNITSSGSRVIVQ